LGHFNEVKERLSKQSKDKSIADFKKLLEEQLERKSLNENSDWKEVKNKVKALNSEVYEKVGSSSLRSQLFESFLMSQVLLSHG